MKLENVIAIRPTKTIYRDEDKVIKVFNQEFSKASVLNEALNQARVEETDLNIPKLLAVTKVGEKWAIVSEYIEGKTLAQLIQENPQKKDEYIEMLVDIQLEIFRKRVPMLNKLIEKTLNKISRTDLDEHIKYELSTRLEGMRKHRKVCHGDLEPSNIIITAEGKAYIIDWAHVTQGNGSADVAKTYLTFWLNKDEDGAKKYLDMFCKKADVERHHVQKWIPMVAAAQLAKGVPEEREFLRNWINVVEY